MGAGHKVPRLTHVPQPLGTLICGLCWMGNICKIMKEMFLPEGKQSRGIFFMTCRCAKGWDSGLVGRTDSSLRSHFILKLSIKWCWCFSRNAQSAKQKTSQHGGEWHIAMETKLLCCASLFKIKSVVCLLQQLMDKYVHSAANHRPAFLISLFSSDVAGTR